MKGIHPKDIYDHLGFKSEKDNGIIMRRQLPLIKKDILKRVHNAKTDKLVGKDINIPLFRKYDLNKALVNNENKSYCR